ncbi:MAG TPA: hypothetical protein PK675_02590 [Clostridia bacterium]|nr:hypothetical protein [Clostridia bacterium]
MIVAKFGGSGVTHNNLSKIQKIVSCNPDIKHVVVSAVGKANNSDRKVTDMLIEYSRSFDKKLLKKILEAYLTIKEKYKLKTDIENIITKSLLKTKNYSYLVSRGEYFSAILVAELLDFAFIDTKNIVKFKADGRLDTQKSAELIAKTLAKIPRSVLTGFYGSDPFGKITLFSRGGSDITGALVADAVDAVIYENWTDVNGFLTANPQKVLNPKTIECMSYGQLAKLNRIGADVLHPLTVLPLVKKSIPLNIRNIFNPSHCGTLISRTANKKGLLAVTSFEAVYSVFDKFLPSQCFESLKFYNSDTITRTLTEKSVQNIKSVFETPVEYIQAVYYGKFDADQIIKKLGKVFFMTKEDNTVSIITEQKSTAVQTVYEYFSRI